MSTISPALLAILFAGAFLDAAPVTCLFVFGEAFFLMAGGLAFTTGSPWPLLAVYAGAWSADQTGFLLGRRLRTFTRRFLMRRAHRRRHVRRAERLLERGGPFAIAATRFMGPIAWITPAIAGSLSIRYAVFACGSFIGVILGVGQFLVLGWLAAFAAARGGGVDINAVLQTHGWAILIAGQFLFAAALVLWQAVRHLRRSTRLHQG